MNEPARLLAPLLVPILLAACGSADPPGRLGPGDAAAASSGGAESDASSSSGGGGAGGTVSSSGGSGGQTGDPVTCGEAACTNTSGLEPCCTESDECGAFYPSLGATGCIRVNQEGRVDPSCPTLFGEPTGCCRPDGYCGAFYTRAFGCLDVRSLPDMGVELTECFRYTAGDRDASVDAGRRAEDARASSIDAGGS